MKSRYVKLLYQDQDSMIFKIDEGELLDIGNLLILVRELDNPEDQFNINPLIVMEHVNNGTIKCCSPKHHTLAENNCSPETNTLSIIDTCLKQPSMGK